MAERRMFAKSIVLSDAFLDMPLTARCLYFTLGMLADDDGFVGNPKAIMRQCGASQDDMIVLLQKRFILSFDSGVIVIKHWRMNNYLQSDRHKKTTYIEELATLELDNKGAYTEKEKAMYTNCIQNVYTGKDSIGKNSIDKDIPPIIPQREKGKAKTAVATKDELEQLLNETAFSDSLKYVIRAWLAYKREKGQGYKPMGFKQLLTKITNQLSIETEDMIERDIEECMSRNYAGIFFGIAQKTANKGQQSTQDWIKMWEEA